VSEPPPHQPLAAAEEHAAKPGLRSSARVRRRGAPSAPSSPYAHKFRLAAGVLAILAIGAIAIAIIAASAGRVTTKAWSAWKPQFNGIAGARQIAGYVSPGYRISAEQQLAVVTVSTNLDGSTLILQEGPSIPGKPSVNRLLLVRLEAFELALYSFRYLSDVQNVVSILPPAVQQGTAAAKGTTPSLSPTPPATLGKTIVAVEFNRHELQPILSDPLSDFFPSKPLALGGVPTSQAIATMDFITANQLFTPSTETGQDGTQYLVLSQLPAQ